MLHKYLIKEQTFTKENYSLADVSGDGKVNIIDLAMLKEMIK